MYVAADNACNMQSGETPLSPVFIAGTLATCAAADAAVNNADANWDSVVSRNWQSFAGLGPYIAWQLRDGNATGAAVVEASPNVTGGPATAIPLAPAPPIGIDLIPQGNPDGGNPAAGASGGSGGGWVPDLAGGSMWRPINGRGAATNRRRGGGAARAPQDTRALSPSDKQFLQTFGLPPVDTYVGPQPDPGSVLSLTYGGSGRSVIVGPGKYAAPTPDATAGYYRAACDFPTGISMLPVGEPAYPGAAAALDGGGIGVGGALLALLALAGLAFLADRSDKKHGRTKA